MWMSRHVSETNVTLFVAIQPANAFLVMHGPGTHRAEAIRRVASIGRVKGETQWLLFLLAIAPRETHVVAPYFATENVVPC